MARSARRLSNTRSGVVRGASFLARIAFLSLAAPIPPVALLRGKPGILGLRHSGGEGVQAADVDMLLQDTAEFIVKFPGILTCKLGNGADAQQLEIPQHGGANGCQVLQTTLHFFHKNLLDREISLLYSALV